MAKRTILVVEDDPSIRRGLVDALEFGGYSVIACADGDSGLRAALGADIDLLLLDLVLPGTDGFSILEQVRAARTTLPVIMVTARGAEDDRIHGLETGADDYVVKPFSARELLARVEAVLRRSPERPEDIDGIEVAGVRVSLARREVSLDGDENRMLSEKEAAILGYLARHHGRAISREELLQRVWGLDPKGLEARTVDMHVARLREKLKSTQQPHDQGLILTVRGKGYMLAESAQVVER